MARLVRNTLITAKIETTAGTDASPTGSANAILVKDFTPPEYVANNIARNLVRGYFGASEELVGTAYAKCGFKVELAGSGTAGTAPAWGPLWQACAGTESTLLTPSRVEYGLLSTAQKTLTIYWYDDGVLHKLTGSIGNAKLSAKVGGIFEADFEFMGVYNVITATANATGTFTSWKTPPALTKANVVDVTLGGSYAAGVITGGTGYATTGITLDLGNKNSFTPTLSTESMDTTDRETTGTVEFDITAAQEVSFMSNVVSNTTQSLSMVIGTVAGNKNMLYAPSVQFVNPKKTELNGRRTISYDMRMVPGSGNDEFKIICL